MKTKEELNALKKEVETLNKKLAELTEEELVQVCGGRKIAEALIAAETPFTIDNDGKKQYENSIYTFETVEEAKRKFERKE